MATAIALSVEMIEGIQRASERSTDGSVLVEQFPEQVMLAYRDERGTKTSTGFNSVPTDAMKLHDEAKTS